MKVLIACEYSGIVRKAFTLKGHKTYSCDLLPSEIKGGRHLQCDLATIINDKWDLIIAFPPCTHLAVSGAKHFAEKIKDGRQRQAIDFFMMVVNCKCTFVAIENPVGIMSTVWRKPNQIIQPYQFGDSYKKTTCLWLKNLPLLKPTSVVDPGEFVIHGGKKIPKWYSNRTRDRDRTFPGIAAAMAEQWG